MAWRFKASKYKNATPVVPKPETYVRDICVGSYQTYGNNITSSGQFMAFNWDHVGSSLAVLPLDDCGRKSKIMPLLHAHSDTVTDMDFSPFHDGLLATGSQDCLVKIWHIPEEGLVESMSNAECTFSHKQRRVETVGWHPTANCLLTSTSYATVTLWDLVGQQELYSNSESSEVIQSVSWKRDGTLLCTSSKDKQLRILDPRVEQTCLNTANSHQSIKDSRVVWLGESNRILTTGFDAQRLRQVIIRDIRNFGETEKTLELDCSTGVLMPLYDADTGMLFLAGKGDTTVSYMEITEREPYLIEGIRHHGEQTKGACLVPKRALAVMQGEVNRVLQLTGNAVVPVTYQVPRKTYRDFHGDLYPDTPGYVTSLLASHWFQGKNNPLKKISLDPSKRQNGDEPITINKGPLAKFIEDLENLVINEPVSKPLPIIAKKPEPMHPVKDLIKGLEKERAFDQRDKSPINAPDNKFDYLKEKVDQNASKNHENIEPRLGPKPFTPTMLTDTETFDKVFSVPQVPVNHHSNGTTHRASIEADKPLFQHQDKSPDSDQSSNSQGNHESLENIDDGNIYEGSNKAESDQQLLPLDDLDCEYKPKTPSTAERRKLFEVKGSSKENDEDCDGLDAPGNFERASAQRNSIAERRKMYERSQSTQDNTNIIVEKVDGSPVLLRRKDSFKGRKNGDINKDDNRKSAGMIKQQSLDPSAGKKADAPKRTSTVFGRVSKFRHLKGTPAHKSLHIENIRNLSRQISGECDGFHANRDRMAVPLSGPGGRIAILEASKPGRLPDGVIPALVHGTANVQDFAFDPFCTRRFAVGMDDGVVHIWMLPEDGLTEPTNTPTQTFAAHADKIHVIRFHPSARDVLATAAHDLRIKLWDLSKADQSPVARIILTGHTEQLFAFAWSPCGGMCATVSKDGKLRLYSPRQSATPIREGRGPVGTRGARVVFALDGRYLVTLGFDRVSERQVTAYRADDLSFSLNTVGLDVSPAILIPFYDEDSSTLFLTGKGDTTIYAFEVTEEAPYICPLSHHRCNSLHQGLSFLPKNVCDVSSVEFAKALRLTNNTIEPLSFTVPRIKTDLFQDDLFPPTRVTWKPTLSAEEWFNGKDKAVQRISLKPEGMDSLSDSQGQAVVERPINKSASQPFIGATQPFNRLGWNVEMSGQTKAKQEEIQKSVSSRMEINLKLEQDDMEGVDPTEWDE